MLRHQRKTVRTLWFGLNHATGRTLCHTHLVNFLFLMYVLAQMYKNRYFTGKKNDEGWAGGHFILFYF
jgi:hypothetical protein